MKYVREVILCDFVKRRLSRQDPSPDRFSSQSGLRFGEAKTQLRWLDRNPLAENVGRD